MDFLICITCLLEINAFSVLHYVMVALHYSYVTSIWDLRFLALEQSRMALLGGCLAASRNYVHLWVGSLYVLQGKLIWFISWIGRDVITTIFSKILHVQMVVYSLIQGSWYSAMLQFCIILINWKLWLTANFRLSFKNPAKNVYQTATFSTNWPDFFEYCAPLDCRCCKNKRKVSVIFLAKIR